MKTKHTLLAMLAGSLLAATAHAQVEVTLTGSTAFRSVTYDRALTLFDPGSFTGITNGSLLTWSGTMSNSAALGSVPVKLRFSFSGSGSGMLAVYNSTPVSTAQTTTNTINKVPDLALSDVYPTSAAPPIPCDGLDDALLGVVPFVFAVNQALYGGGVTGIARDQAYTLMTDSGITTSGTNTFYGMPASYLGGSSTNSIYLVGRDSGSGTRLTVFADIGYFGNPTQWATNFSTGAYFKTPGLSSGGDVGKTLAARPDAIGYLGLADLGVNAALTYNGVPFSHANVTGGKYGLWGYEHLVNRPLPGGLDSNQQAVRDALIAAITNPGYQGTNNFYTNFFSSISEMKVGRGNDGGPVFRK